ncbi:MAG: EamA family transporter [Syntrophomonadaceae bacterium]|jgi:drug/metabolite transporter (DMT)-like permease
MFFYFLPILMIVASNVVYNICQKSTPQSANPFTALFITYLTAAILTLIAYQFHSSEKGFVQSITDLNWTSLVLGVSIVGLELGYLLAYRAGWNISIGSLVANILLALALIPVGILFYHEGFDTSKTVGVVFCIIGLLLINRL